MLKLINLETNASIELDTDGYYQDEMAAELFDALGADWEITRKALAQYGEMNMKEFEYDGRRVYRKQHTKIAGYYAGDQILCLLVSRPSGRTIIEQYD